ncbi:type III secretion HpaP family protein [Paracidovorax anthurii]|nr:type III secretion HpaP family protein [Paracidovorax anthurii]
MSRADAAPRARPGHAAGMGPQGLRDASSALAAASERFQRQLTEPSEGDEAVLLLFDHRVPAGMPRREGGEPDGSDEDRPPREPPGVLLPPTGPAEAAEDTEPGPPREWSEADRAPAESPMEPPRPEAARSDAGAADSQPPPPPPSTARQAGSRDASDRSPQDGDRPADGSTHLAGADGPSATEPPAWLQDTVQRIAWLCAQAGPSFQSWAVTVPMDPEVLPDCEVALSISPYAMSLRFRTGSPRSAHLISLHRDPLRAQLEALSPGQRGIDIDLE